VISGIVGGIIVGTLSGSPLGVSGPAAGLAVIVLAAIGELGYQAFLLAVVLAGLLQLILGFLKAGVIGYYFPSSVIKGMLSGIGIIIFLKQIPHGFGYDADPEGDFAFMQRDGHTTFSELYYMFDYITPGAVVVTIISLFILIVWERPWMKKYTITRVIQGPLVAVIISIFLGLLFDSSDYLRIEASHMVALPVAASLSEFLGFFTFPDFTAWSNSEVYITAITLAIVGSLETLLCLEATDKLDPYKRITPTNRELRAQGIGNMISGLIGGLPITQVIVRSSANIQSGGKTKTSAIMHGVFLLASVIVIPHVLNLLPLATLAAILFIVGYKLAKPRIFKEMYAQGWTQFIPFITTVLGIVFTDLLVGISLGMLVAIFYILYSNYMTPYFVKSKDFDPSKPIHLRLSEQVTFFHKATILKTLKNLPEGSVVHIDASRTIRIDNDVQEILEDFCKNAEHKHIELHFDGFENKNLVHPIHHLNDVIFNYQESKNDIKVA
jgi:MFS superfamily sulfate permease-like transporter